MKKDIKFTFVFVFLLACFNLYAQQGKVKIELRDYHTSPITDVVSSNIYPYFFTADESGKILISSSKTKRVLKTLKAASGIPIKSLRLAFEDKVLTVNQKFSFGDGKQDSIISIGVFDQKILQKLPGSVEFIGNQDDVIIIKDTNADKSLHIIDLYDRNFKEINKYYASKRITLAAYDSISKSMAMVEAMPVGKEQINVSLQKGNDYKNSIKIEIPENLQIQDLFFESSLLFAITKDKKTNEIEIYNLSAENKFSKPSYKTSFENLSFSSISVLHFFKNNVRTIVLTPKVGYFGWPIIIEIKNLKFNESQPKLEHGTYKSVYLKNNDELLFFDDFKENIQNSVRFSVYQNNKHNVESVFPKDSLPFYSGLYLPQDNWLIKGSGLSKNHSGFNSYKNQFKYYNAGTFNNRFGTLNYNDYLEIKHNVVDMSNQRNAINKETGLSAFYGYKKEKDELVYGFFVYDIINDTVSKLITKEVKKRNIVDYNAKNKYLLLSAQQYYNAGYTAPQEFVVLQNNEVTQIEGRYKFGRFSNNGDYLLLISDKNELIVKHFKTNKTIFTKALIDGKYEIFIDGEQDFLVSNSFFEMSFERCNQNTVTISISDSQNVQDKTLDCFNIIDVASKADVSALSVENIGLIIGEKIYKFPRSEFPDKISLNDDGSQIMVSFNNGKIKVYKVEGLELVAEMVHPDKDSHVFVNRDNYYFSNVDPENYLVAAVSGKLAPINTLENQYFNPEKVLNTLGKPNEDYLKLLNKAISLRQENLYANSNVVLEEEEAFEINKTGEKGDLYVLSVGVSNYDQSDFNLTFADKDALDIAKIYGELSETELLAYKTKFYGHSFVLNNNSGDFVGALKKYTGIYFGVKDFYPLTIDGRYWLEASDNAFLLWNYKDKTIEPIKMPSGFKLGVYSFEPVIFVNPDNDGFYIKTEDDTFYSYSFSDKVFRKIDIAKPLKNAQFSSENLVMLNQKRWGYFSSQSDGFRNKIIVSIGKNNKDDVKRISFNPDAYIVNNGDGKAGIDSASVYHTQLKSISTNGVHLLYRDLNHQLYYKNLSLKNELPIKLSIEKLNTLDACSIANDGQTFSVVRKGGDTFKYKVETFNLEGTLLREQTFGKDVIGFSDYDNTVYSVSVKSPLVKEELFNTEDLLNSGKPISFNNRFVKYLVNDAATSATIEQEIIETFKNAKPQDQVVVFLAGHGVLDKDLNYYYAASDMDFDNVTRKGVAFSAIIESINTSKANSKLLLMDTCHAGNTLNIDEASQTATQEKSTDMRGSKSRNTDPKSKFKLSDVVSTVFDDFMSKSGVTIISASSGEDVAYENKELGNGAFTSAYISFLKQGLLAGGFVMAEENLKNPVVLDDYAISEILKQVMLLTNGKQTSDLREINNAVGLKMW